MDFSGDMQRQERASSGNISLVKNLQIGLLINEKNIREILMDSLHHNKCRQFFHLKERN